MPESRYVRNTNQPISNDHRTFGSPCRHINTKHFTIHTCQGVRPKRKEFELYLKENNFDIVALNETFLTKKIDFKIQGYDTIKNDRSTGARGGVAFLVKHGLVINIMFVGDFNTKLEAFGCAKKDTSGPMLKNIQSQLNLFKY